MYPEQDVYRKETSDDQESQMLARAGWFSFKRRLIAWVGRGKAAIGFNVLLIVTFPMAFSETAESTPLASVLEPTPIGSVELPEPAVELVDHQFAEPLKGSPTELSPCRECSSGLFSDEFCRRWKAFGTLYSNDDGKLLQELKFIGRFHYQYGLVDGRPGGGEPVDYETDEMRRFRLGGTAKFLRVWDLYAEAEVSDDQRPRGGDLRVRFKHMWQLKAHLDLKKAWDLDEIDGFKFGFGSREINMSYEWVTSSKRIKTVERSAIANKIWAYNTEFANPTGVWAIADQGDYNLTLGVFSTTQDDWWASFNDGELYYSNLHWESPRNTDTRETDIRWTAFYQNVSQEEESLAAGLEWASALSLQRRNGRRELQVEGILGDNGEQSRASREGTFWGLVIMPSIWLVENKLEAVVKFQYQGSDGNEGIRLNSRYIRRAGAREDFPELTNGRGDEHYSLYAGINRLFCEHQQKVMFGIEYDSLQQDDINLYDGWSLYAAYRTYW